MNSRVLSLLQKLSFRNNRTSDATLNKALVGVAESITAIVTSFKTRLEELLEEATISAQAGRTAELSEFSRRLKMMTDEAIGSCKAEIDDAVDVRRRELRDALEKLCASATDELELLRKRTLASIDEHLSGKIQELESLGASSLAKAKDGLQRELNALSERSKLSIDEMFSNFEIEAKKRVEDAVGAVRSRVGEAVSRESSRVLEGAKTDLSKVVEAGRVKLDGRVNTILEDASGALQESVSKKIADAQHVFAEMVEESKRQLKAELSAASGDIASALARAKMLLSELKRFEEKQTRIQTVTAELSTRLLGLERELGKHGEEMDTLEKGLKEQFESTEMFSSILSQYVARTQERIEALNRQTEQAFRDWGESIAAIPGRVEEATAKGYSQALVDVRVQAVRELNLATRNLHAELDRLEREIREKVKTIQEAIAVQERAVKTVVQSSGDDSLSRWVEELLSDKKRSS